MQLFFLYIDSILKSADNFICFLAFHLHLKYENYHDMYGTICIITVFQRFSGAISLIKTTAAAVVESHLKSRDPPQ